MCRIFNFPLIGLVTGTLLLQIYCKPPGSKCYNSKSPGMCSPLTDCALALEAVRETGSHDLKRCGFEGFTEIVCCPITELRHTITTEKTKNDEVQPKGPEIKRRSQKACEDYAKDFSIVLTYHIVGGENAEAGEFPHMAALGFYNVEEQQYEFSCGGTLISPNYIVTAAHCLINVQQRELKVARLGVLKVPEIIKKPDPKIDYNIINVTVHREYNWKEKVNDIALVKLEKKVNFNNTIRPACLYAKNDDPQSLTITGWGVIKFGGERSEALQKAAINAVPIHECNQTYQSRANRYITKNQLCAADNISDACQGDSGGPIQTPGSNGLLSIVGVTSYGIACGGPYPGVYTRISSYLDWIEGIVWP